MKVLVVQYEHQDRDLTPTPRPLEHHFREDRPYKVFQWLVEAGELKAVLVNDEEEVWLISNRHLRRA